MGIKRGSLAGGEVFGYLTVEDLSHSCKRADGSAGERVMDCVCKCGNKVKIRTSNLYSGNTKPCGCLHKERTVASNIARTEPYRACNRGSKAMSVCPAQQTACTCYVALRI